MKALLLVLVLCFGGSVYGVEFKKIDEAVKAAKKEDKNVFLYFGTSWCPGCIEMKRVFKNVDVKKKMESMPYVIIDCDDDDDGLLKKYKISSIPDYMIIDNNGEILKRTKGAMSPSEFSKWLGEE